MEHHQSSRPNQLLSSQNSCKNFTPEEKEEEEYAGTFFQSSLSSSSSNFQEFFNNWPRNGINYEQLQHPAALTMATTSSSVSTEIPVALSTYFSVGNNATVGGSSGDSDNAFYSLLLQSMLENVSVPASSNSHTPPSPAAAAAAAVATTATATAVVRDYRAAVLSNTTPDDGNDENDIITRQHHHHNHNHDHQQLTKIPSNDLIAATTINTTITQRSSSNTGGGGGNSSLSKANGGFLLQPSMIRTRMCKLVSDGGSCPRGDSCMFAHSKEELREAPDFRFTRVCTNIDPKTGVCPNGITCKFAHSDLQLRATPDICKTTICEKWKKTGKCSAGRFCRYAHGSDERRCRGRIMKARGDSGNTNFVVCEIHGDLRFADTSVTDVCLLKKPFNGKKPNEQQQQLMQQLLSAGGLNDDEHESLYDHHQHHQHHQENIVANPKNFQSSTPDLANDTILSSSSSCSEEPSLEDYKTAWQIALQLSSENYRVAVQSLTGPAVLEALKPFVPIATSLAKSFCQIRTTSNNHQQLQLQPQQQSSSSQKNNIIAVTEKN